jgi:ATP:corrinoid adenosyltransferase
VGTGAGGGGPGAGRTGAAAGSVVVAVVAGRAVVARGHVKFKSELSEEIQLNKQNLIVIANTFIIVSK